MSRADASWPLELDPETEDSLPLFLRVARALALDIRRGRLRPGAALPGTRSLAESLGVHRNTILAAYRELQSEGWITAQQGKGTVVAETLPDPKPKRFAREPGSFPNTPAPYALDRALEALPTARSSSGALLMYGGLPDLSLVPVTELARAWKRAASKVSLLGYAEASGSLSLRSALASMLSSTRGLSLQSEDLLLTRGSQMGLYLAAQTILSEGDVVAVEAFGYRPAWEALRSTGARLVPISVDEQGLCVDELAALAENERVRAVYVTPHHQYPTTVTLHPSRRLQLLQLCRRARIALFEDDYDHEFHYDVRPVLPLASADTGGVVVYIGTLSKVLAPALRLGYVAAPRAVLERMTALRARIDRHGDSITETAVAELIDDGTLQRHIRKARRLYGERRALCVELLQKLFGNRASFRVPAGGMALWVRLEELAPERLLDAAEEEGVLFQPGSYFDFHKKKLPFARIGFAALDEEQLREAVERLERAVRRCDRKRSSVRTKEL